MYFNTSSNRADGPTRGRKPDAPDLELPGWWDRVDADDFDEFDTWMEDAGAPDPGAGLPYADIAGTEQLKLQSKASAKRVKKTRPTGPAKPKVDDKDVSPPLTRSSKPEPGVLQLLRSLPRSQFFFAEGVDDFYEAGALDLFSGRYGVAKQMIKAGAPWALTYEWNRSAEENLLRDDVRQTLRDLLRGGAFKTMWEPRRSVRASA